MYEYLLKENSTWNSWVGMIENIYWIQSDNFREIPMQILILKLMILTGLIVWVVVEMWRVITA